MLTRWSNKSLSSPVNAGSSGTLARKISPAWTTCCTLPQPPALAFCCTAAPIRLITSSNAKVSNFALGKSRSRAPIGICAITSPAPAAGQFSAPNGPAEHPNIQPGNRCASCAVAISPSDDMHPASAKKAGRVARFITPPSSSVPRTRQALRTLQGTPRSPPKPATAAGTLSTRSASAGHSGSGV